MRILVAALVVFTAGMLAGSPQKTDDKPFVEKEIKGKLAEVQPKEVTLQTSQGMRKIEVTPTTRVRIGAKDGSIADLRPGMPVAITYVVREQRSQATTIIVVGP